MRGYIIGCDPGGNGGFAILDGTSGEVMECVKMPSTPMDILNYLKNLFNSDKISNFAIAYKMIVNYPEWAAVIAQRVWAFFMSILYPHTAVSLRKINAFRGYHLVSSANDTAFCVCNPSKTE